MGDPEIRDLQVATARAYAIAERLAAELEVTVDALISRTQQEKNPYRGALAQQNQPRRT